MNAPRALLVLAALFVAGCAGPSGSKDFGAEYFDPDDFLYEFNGYHWGKAVVTEAQGNYRILEPADVSQDLPRPVVAVVHRVRADSGYAPPNFLHREYAELALAPNGTMFVATKDLLTRSGDHGVTWKVVFELRGPEPQHGDVFSSAASAFAYDAANDQLFVAMLHLRNGADPTPISCMALARSPDGGDTWERPPTTNWPTSCIRNYGSTQQPGLRDRPLTHQRMSVAAPAPVARDSVPDPFRGPDAPTHVYLCDVGRCWVSEDWGASFREAAAAPGCYGAKPVPIEGGAIALSATCGGPVRVMVSEDGGRTWTGYLGPAADTGPSSDLAVSRNGTAYLVYQDAGMNATYLIQSKDRFQTWSEPVRISPSFVTNVRNPTVVVGDDGRFAVTYLGTRTRLDVLNPDTYKDTGGHRVDWHIYATLPFDLSGGSELVTLQLTPEEYPAIVGHADCFTLRRKTYCPISRFFDAELDQDGRLHFLGVTGCTPRSDCPGDLNAVQRQTIDTQLALLVQDTGWSFYADRPNVPSLGLNQSLAYAPKGVPLK